MSSSLNPCNIIITDGVTIVNWQSSENLGAIFLALILATSGSIVILLARSSDSTETVNTAEKEVSRRYQVRSIRDQGDDVNCKASTDDEFKSFVNELFVNYTYWKNRTDNINNLMQYYVSVCIFDYLTMISLLWSM